MSDDLRDRIEAVILRATDDGVDPAQAIIDEFGLTKEWQMASRQILRDGTAIENPTQARTVGKWEKQ